ncbi:MAG: hypothetical protein NTV23_03640 [Propionibacteriales bacterium]|nr:hypothetical protein [Propionibacteriales bacterium]
MLEDVGRGLLHDAVDREIQAGSKVEVPVHLQRGSDAGRLQGIGEPSDLGGAGLGLQRRRVARPQQPKQTTQLSERFSRCVLGGLQRHLPFIIPAFLGSFLGLALLFIAVGRAGELAWGWVAVTLVGLILVVAAPVHLVTVIGFVAMSTGLAAAGARLLRG